MKILFDNRLLAATLSCLHPNTSYPASNLADSFCRKVWKSTSGSDALTLLWASDQEVDSAFVEFTNAAAMRVQLYDVGDSVLYDGSLTTTNKALYFAAVSGVRKAVLTFSGVVSGVLRVGKVGIGTAYEMPDPKSDWTPGQKDLSNKVTSAGGQVLQDYVEPLLRIKFGFFVQTFALYKEIKALFAALARPVFVDFTSEDHSFYPVMYSDVDAGFSDPGRDDYVFTFSITFTEAR